MLEGMSTWRYISYYRCAVCGHVWSIDRSDPGNPKVVSVTALRESGTDQRDPSADPA